jgi:hypothetical protein
MAHAKVIKDLRVEARSRSDARMRRLGQRKQAHLAVALGGSDGFVLGISAP